MGVMEQRRSIIANEPHLYTATGNPATFSTDMVGRLAQVKCAFSPVQSGSGDPSPSNVRPITGWTGVTAWRTGANIIDWSLYPFTDKKAFTPNGVTVTTGEIVSNNYHCATLDFIPCSHLRGQKITFSPSEPTTSYASICFYESADESTYISGSAVNKTGEVPSNANYMRFMTNRDNFNTAKMLNIGETELPYTPYTGQTIPVTFPALGKNLLNPLAKQEQSSPISSSADTKRTFVPGSCVIGLSAENYYRANYENYVKNISLQSNSIQFTSGAATGYGIGYVIDNAKPGETYTFSAESMSASSAALLYYKSDGTFIKFDLISGATKTRFVPTDTATMVLCIYASASNSDVTCTKPMLEKNSSATTYEPYTNTVYGGYADIVNGQLVAEWTSAVANGSYDWSFTESVGKNRVNTNGVTLCGKAAKADGQIIFNYAKSGKTNAFDGWISGTGNILLYVPSEINSASAWSSYLSDNPLQICFELATPIVYPLTPQQIAALKGDNVIWSDTNGTNTIEYWKH